MPQPQRILIAALILSSASCGPSPSVPSRVRMANQSLAQLGADEGLFRETAIELPRAWRPAALAVSPHAGFVATGPTIFEIRQGTEPRSVCTLEEDVVALAWRPSGGLLAASRSGVYAVDSGTFRRLFQAPDTERAHFASLAASDSRIWIGDAGCRKVWILDRDGKLVAGFGERTAVYPGILAPSPHLDVLALADGGFANVNPGRHRLEIRNADGRLLRSFGREGMGLEGFAGCCNPTDAAVLPDGRFATFEKGLPRIKLFHANGEFSELVAGSAAFHPKLEGGDLQCDPLGRIWFLDARKRKVRIFFREGRRP
ncbi:MAG: hypothetical protein N2109_06150 [Fimbriimonadales bacterium]|nr:hypothetical protein [Fimbriimonadales bacterium]